MFSPNVINGVLQSRFDEITTHLNHQLSFSPLSNKGNILVDDNFYDFEVNSDGHLYSPQQLEGYDFYGGKSYLGHYNNLNFSPSQEPTVLTFQQNQMGLMLKRCKTELAEQKLINIELTKGEEDDIHFDVLDILLEAFPSDRLGSGSIYVDDFNVAKLAVTLSPAVLIHFPETLQDNQELQTIYHAEFPYDYNLDPDGIGREEGASAGGSAGGM